jgi:ribosome-interacting GTPase 1
MVLKRSLFPVWETGRLMDGMDKNAQGEICQAKVRKLTPTTSGGGEAGAGFDVARTGVASVGSLEFLSVGKSTTIKYGKNTRAVNANYVDFGSFRHAHCCK